MTKKILIIEDDTNVASCIASMLVGSERFTAENLKSAKELMSQVDFDIIISDLCLPDSPDPEQTLSMVAMLGGNAVKIGVSGLVEADRIPEGFDAVANKLDIMTPGELLSLIHRATQHARSIPPLERKTRAIEMFARHGSVCYRPELATA